MTRRSIPGRRLAIFAVGAALSLGLLSVRGRAEPPMGALPAPAQDGLLRAELKEEARAAARQRIEIRLPPGRPHGPGPADIDEYPQASPG